jgi:shikimate dehydrogenase
MPFKRAVLDLCDEVAMAAKMAGAVNTVHVVEGRLVGYNTDGRGLLEALQTEAGFTPQDKHIVIVGSGGAAGGAFVAFLLARAASITVVGRSLQSSEELLERMTPHLSGIEATAMIMHEAEESIRRADLIVNATPVGMWPEDRSPVPLEWLETRHLVYDMVYGTAEPTALVRGAVQAGVRALDGLSMLVAQGATAVDIWNNSRQTRAPRDVMRAAIERELESRRMRG